MTRSIVFAAALVVLAACARDDVRTTLPRGLVVVAHAHAACEQARAIGGDALQIDRVARVIEKTTCACAPSDLAWSVADDGELATALRTLRCDAHAPASIAAVALGADDVLRVVFAAHDEDARTTAVWHADARGLAIDVTPSPSSAASILVGTAIAPRLNDDGALVHVGASTSPASLAALLDDDQAARMLPGVGVAARALLDGAWELAVYEARRGADDALWPVVRVGVRAPSRLLDVLAHTAESQWHLTAERSSIANRDAVCVPDARMLPSLGPCAIVDGAGDGDALVVAWNKSALEHAIGGASKAMSGLALDRFGAHEPWSRVTIEPGATSTTLHVAKAPP